MRRHLRDYKVGVMAYENAEQLILVDAYEEEESSEKYFIANQYSLEKYAVMERRFCSALPAGDCVWW